MTMLKNIFKHSTYFIIALGLVVGASSLYAVWQGPTALPPNPNVAAPINVGDLEQTKAGKIKALDFCLTDGSRCLSVATNGPAPKMYILNDGVQTVNDVCINDVDIRDYCGDENGCTVRFYMNHKTVTNDEVRFYESAVYLEDPSFSSRNSATVYGNSMGYDVGYTFVLSDTNQEVVTAPRNSWASVLDYANSRCGGTGATYNDPYKVTLHTDSFIRTKIVFYDDGVNNVPPVVAGRNSP